EALPGWKGEFWRRGVGGAGWGLKPARWVGGGGRGDEPAGRAGERDPFTIARDVAPVVFPPGTRYAYSNPGIGMLGYCVTAAMQGTAEPDLRAMMLRRVFGPLGVDEAEWSIGYNTPYVLDGLTLYAGWGGGAFTPRAVARVARLLLAEGRWQGTTLLPEGRVRQALTYAGLPLPDRRVDPAAPASGLAWYGNQDGTWPGVPRDAFAGAGAQHQLLLAVPSLGLIVVRNGGSLEPPTGGVGFWSAALRHVFQPVVDALR
ncbi:MAG TPA: serine hydrolase, partial [Chloroflexota bacterium]|nr:serine hydrolase [Chloroflexota bacterium]